MSGKLHQYSHLVELALEMVFVDFRINIDLWSISTVKSLIEMEYFLEISFKKSCNACFGLVPGHKHMSSSLLLLSLLINC